MKTLKPNEPLDEEWLEFIYSLLVPKYSDSSTIVLSQLVNIVLQKRKQELSS